MSCFALVYCSRNPVFSQEKERLSPQLGILFPRTASDMDPQKCSYPTSCFGQQLAFESVLSFIDVPGSRHQKVAVIVMIRSLSRCLSAHCPLSQNFTFLILWLCRRHQYGYFLRPKKLIGQSYSSHVFNLVFPLQRLYF